MMTITTHPSSAKYIVIKEPTAEALDLAGKLTPKWGRIEKNGTITMHTNFRNDFQRLIQPAAAGKTQRVYVTAEEFEDGVGACVGWNIVENAGTNQAVWRKA
jgi:predicted DNA-binding WGR domain protein